MKLAKELFKELGFERDDRYADRIIYYDYCGYKVTFWLVGRKYLFGIPPYYYPIDTELHKAITKQMEELGWFDE